MHIFILRTIFSFSDYNKSEPKPNYDYDENIFSHVAVFVNGLNGSGKHQRLKIWTIYGEFSFLYCFSEPHLYKAEISSIYK